MRCRYCDAPMTTDDGVCFYCTEGCVRCCAFDLINGELVKCSYRALDGTDNCLAHQEDLEVAA